MNCFTEHPNDMGETYCQHLVHAWKLSFESFKTSVVFFIHGLFPCCFTTTGSAMVQRTNDYLIE